MADSLVDRVKAWVEYGLTKSTDEDIHGFDVDLLTEELETELVEWARENNKRHGIYEENSETTVCEANHPLRTQPMSAGLSKMHWAAKKIAQLTVDEKDQHLVRQHPRKRIVFFKSTAIVDPDSDDVLTFHSLEFPLPQQTTQ